MEKIAFVIVACVQALVGGVVIVATVKEYWDVRKYNVGSIVLLGSVALYFMGSAAFLATRAWNA